MRWCVPLEAMRAADSLPERYRSPRNAAGDVRCTGCRTLLAKTDHGKLTIRRSDLQATVVADGHVSLVCYRCQTQVVVPVTSKTITPDLRS